MTEPDEQTGIDFRADEHEPPLDNAEDAQYLDPDDPRRKAAEAELDKAPDDDEESA